MEKVKLTMNELFSGIGAQKRGINLTELFDCEVVCTSDIDKEAMLSYAAIHNSLTEEMINTYDQYPSREIMAQLLSERNIGYDFKNNKPYDWNKHIKQKKNKTLEKYYLACVLSDNLGDISLIKELPYADLWTYSFPCQDLSVAGKGAGIKKGTRSGLLLEVERLLEIAVNNETQPKILMLENVKNLVGKNNKDDFDAWLSKLDELGYNTYWQVVNGKDCGIPQNRERVFAISIRKEFDTGLFEFMKPFDNGLRLKDFLDYIVEDKYYINTEKANNLIEQIIKRGYKSNTVLVKDQATNYSKDIEFSNTLMARDWKGFGNQDMVAVVESIRIGGLFDDDKKHQAGSIWDVSAMSPTIDTCQGGYREPCILTKDTVLKIRRLIPKECWKLMGFASTDIQKAMNIGISDTQLYKQAGNSIITYCIKLLMEHIYKAQFDNTYICYDEYVTTKLI
jgi:DNA (cytosine-5)-methyltransferase 1